MAAVKALLVFCDVEGPVAIEVSAQVDDSELDDCLGHLLRPAAIPDRYSQRLRELKREFQQLEYFCQGTLLKRMMKCGKAQCACRQDPAKRHGPYFEWTYKAKGKTVNVKLTPEAMPMFRAASQQYRKLKSLLNRLERLSQTVLRYQAKRARSAHRD